jgi:uncharacterized protein with HEPN domain
VKKDDSVYLRHILDAVSRIEEYTRGIERRAFIEGHMVQDAVMRQIEIIGEATKKLSKEIRDRHAQIPWKDMAGLRDKLIHGYFGVDLDSVWDTVKKDIPQLRNSLKALIES